MLRQRFVQKACQRMVDSWEDEEREECELHGQILREVSESYFEDIKHGVAFAALEYRPHHGRAACMAKWVMKLRPVQWRGQRAGRLAL